MLELSVISIGLASIMEVFAGDKVVILDCLLLACMAEPKSNCILVRRGLLALGESIFESKVSFDCKC